MIILTFFRFYKTTFNHTHDWNAIRNIANSDIKIIQHIVCIKKINLIKALIRRFYRF